MSDRLAEIKARHYSVGFALAEKTAIPHALAMKVNADTAWLLDEIERLKALELEREKNLQRITELGQEIEVLQRNHAAGLKVKGILRQDSNRIWEW